MKLLGDDFHLLANIDIMIRPLKRQTQSYSLKRQTLLNVLRDKMFTGPDLSSHHTASYKYIIYSFTLPTVEEHFTADIRPWLNTPLPFTCMDSFVGCSNKFSETVN